MSDMKKTAGALHEGMKCRSAKADDASTKLKGPSVNVDATRGDKAAPTPKTLGPRTA